MPAREPGIRGFMRSPRTALPTLAVFVTLVLSFAIPPLSSVVAAGSSSGSMSSQSSSPPIPVSNPVNCNNSFSAGVVHPGDTVSGTLFLNNGCRYNGPVNVSLNGASLNKPSDASGDVPVSVHINSMTSGVLDDPVNVTLHQGTNTVVVKGPASGPHGENGGTATIDASFDLEPGPTPTTTTTTTTTPGGCNSSFEAAGNVAPGDKVSGTLRLSAPCFFVGKVTLDLNGAKLQKDPSQDGSVHVTVQIQSLTAAILDDPVNAPIHEGHNTIDASGTSNQGTVAHVLAGFTVVSATTTTVKPLTPVALTQSTGGGGGGGLATTGANLLALFVLALVAIALGTYTIASERAIPVAAGDASLFGSPLGSPEPWTLELVVLGAVALVLGPPPGQHARKGRRGLVPALRDWLYRKR